MPTLYVENVPADLLKAVKERAKKENRSMAAEVIETLKNRYPTEEVMAARRRLYEFSVALRERQRKRNFRKGKTAEQMIREDRER